MESLKLKCDHSNESTRLSLKTFNLDWIILWFQKITPHKSVEGQEKFQGRGGTQKDQILNGSLKLNWNFKGGGTQTKPKKIVGVEIFSRKAFLRINRNTLFHGRTKCVKIY